VKDKAVQFIRLAIGKCVWLYVTLGWNRFLSGLLALIYILGASLVAGAEGGFKIGLGVILPLTCIWFSDEMGGYTGSAGSIWISAPSPGIIVRILGWLVLLLPVIFLIIACFQVL
jgi:hypothetical protein